MEEASAYGLWSLVIINSLVFIIFAFSFAKPQTKRDWRSFSAFSAFIVALFVEMYGFPLTIYLISGWLVRRYPGLDPFSHDAGHLWNTLLGSKINPHFDPLHIFSNVLIFGDSFFWPLLGRCCTKHSRPIRLRRRVLTPMFATRNMSASFSSCSAFYFSGLRSSP
jgi:hypothetical protein